MFEKPFMILISILFPVKEFLRDSIYSLPDTIWIQNPDSQDSMGQNHKKLQFSALAEKFQHLQKTGGLLPLFSAFAGEIA